VGLSALADNTAGYQNAAFGALALQVNTTGNNNTAIGAYAMDGNTNGSQNTAIGEFALFGNTSGSNNIALGFQAGENLTTGSSNIDIGNPGVAGDNNTIRIGSGQSSTFIAGVITAPGFQSDSSGDFAAGTNNIANGGHATVSGGAGNSATGNYATVGGGEDCGASTHYATVAGGYGNTASSLGAVVGGGGYDGTFWNGNTASGRASVVAGGLGNQANNDYSTVAGGRGNTATGVAATVGGGYANTASWGGDFVGGGGYDGQTWNGNSASGGACVVAGGWGNQATAVYATVPGGCENIAGGIFSFAAGQQAQALHRGAFVWADSQEASFSSTANNQFLIRAQGGVGMGTNDPQAQLEVSSSGGVAFPQAQLDQEDMADSARLRFTVGGNVNGRWDVGASATNFEIWSQTWGANMIYLDNRGLTVNGTLVSSSDRNVKAGFEPVDTRSVLEQVAALPITRWHYTNDPATAHLGPVAQDFYAAFSTGADDKHIAVVDEGGVALAAIQGLNRKLEEQAKEKDAEIQDLKQSLVDLKQLVQSLAGKK
jgi:hypothetical protein